ncbi:MAG: non-ribosomal peptide synthetase, partial [Halanaerobiales bacterium]|nr:non-ribosomal peptide synthetase [Halanaerobiales bacterium]
MKRIAKSSNFKSLINIFEQSDLASKGITFIYSEHEEAYVSYEEMYKKSLIYLKNLQNKGIKPGNEIIFQLSDNQDFIYNLWACILGGFIPVLTSIGTTEEQKLKLLQVWSVLDKPYLITSKNITGQYNTVLNNTILIDEFLVTKEEGVIYKSKSNDIAAILFSSGSTGDPKGVVLTHENILAGIMRIEEGFSATCADKFLSWSPLTHILGLLGWHIAPLFLNADQYLMPTDLFMKKPLLWLKKADEHKATFLVSVKFGFKHVLEHYKSELLKNLELSHIRLISIGAEPISADLCHEFAITLAHHGLKENSIFPIYGLTETSLFATLPPVGEGVVSDKFDRQLMAIGDIVKEIDRIEDGIELVDVGYPLQNCRVCDELNNVVDEKVIGYVQISGPNVTSGYYKNDLATRTAFTDDGWLITGDLGFMRKGRLIITGRVKDIIFVNGQNYYPYDIERVAGDVEGIEEVKIAVCGVADDKKYEEKILCFILWEKELDDFVTLTMNLKQHVSKSMGLQIADVLPVKSFPKTASGKLHRYKLGDLYENGEFDSLLVELNLRIKEKMTQKEVDLASDEIEKKLVMLYSEVLSIERAGIYDNFMELGGNSLKAASLVAKIHKKFNVELQTREILTSPTIKEIAEHIKHAEKSKYASIEVVTEKEYYPTSSAQKRIFAVKQVEG